MKKNLFFFLFSSIALMSNAQRHSWSTSEIFGTKLFIQNNGQFDSYTPQNIVSDFAYIHAGNEIYLSDKGFTFRLSKLSLKKEYKELTTEQLNEESERHNIHNRIDNWVSLEWIGANKNATITPNGRSSHYITYGDKKYNSYGFRSIRYNNIYDGIDVLFELHPKGGLEYTLFLEPGADIKQIQFQYKGQNSLSMLNAKKIILKTDIEDMWEGNLKAYYKNGEPVSINYSLQHNIISFKPSKPIDPLRPLIIDPWVTTNTSLSGSTGTTGGENKAYDVDFDIDGNLFVIGGGGNIGSTPNSFSKIAKYDPNGVLLWTFSGVLVAPVWSSSPSSTSYSRVGNLVVDKFSGKTYMSQGLGLSSGAQIIRLDPAGNYDNFITGANNQFREIWDMKFNCITGSVVGMGGGTSSNINFGIVDTTTGVVAISNATGLPGLAQDLASAALGPNNEVYALFSAGAVANDILKINAAYNGNLWNVPSGYLTMGEQQNKPYVAANSFSNGYNALAANNDYLFYYDGFHLKAINTTNGTNVGSAITIPGQTPKMQGGIETNECDEVFIGGPNGNILKYDFDGTNFVASGNPFVIPGHSGHSVYDIVYNSLNNKFYVCGDQFVATVDYVIPCDSNTIQLQLDSLCPDSMLVTILNPDVTATYTFNWHDSITGTLLQSSSPPLGTYVDTLSNLTPNNTYSITVLKNIPCQLQSTTLHFQISCGDTTIYKCPSAYYILNGDTLTVPGIYLDTTNNSTVVLKDHPSHSSTTQASICSGSSYTLPSNIVVSNAGTYIDSFTNQYGCDSLITTILTVINPILQTVSADICSGDTYLLPDNRSVSTAGVYPSRFTSTQGCDSIIETTLSLVSPPTVTLPADSVLCEGTSITVDISIGNPNTTYTWNDNVTTAVRPLHEAGLYIASVTLPPCGPVSDSILIGIKECNCNIFIPNAFSPNGDTKNEIFKPILRCIFPPINYSFKVFNRWGQEVFGTSNYQEGWNGKLQNEDQPIGTYFYLVRYSNPNTKQEFSHKGDVTIVR